MNKTTKRTKTTERTRQNFTDRLIERIDELNSPIVVGLDTTYDHLPDSIKTGIKTNINKTNINIDKNIESLLISDAIYRFNRDIIDNIYDKVPAIKLQMGCYEMYGIHGLRAFNKTCDYGRKMGLMVIGDGKRNDIGSSASYYARAYLSSSYYSTSSYEGDSSTFSVDALTINPYLGTDGIVPFIEEAKNNKNGLFVLVKTSNSSSYEIQDLELADGSKVYERVVELVRGLASSSSLVGKYGYSLVGAVVGSTCALSGVDMKKLREQLSGIFLLVPGYGAQGSEGKDLSSFFDKDGRGAIINASRSIMLAYRSERYKSMYDGMNHGEIAGKEVMRMRDDITKHKN